MSPEDLGAHLTAAIAGSTSQIGYDEVTVQVPLDAWLDAVTLAAQDPTLACAYFDWLSATDEGEAGFAVVVHLYSLTLRHHVRLRTLVPRAQPELASLVALFAGADWHERETAEMFGITFTGHPQPAPLLLPDGFEGTPLRKDFLLASRVVKPWPGGVEP